jgi:hypothetical protein
VSLNKKEPKPTAEETCLPNLYSFPVNLNFSIPLKKHPFSGGMPVANTSTLLCDVLFTRSA